MQQTIEELITVFDRSFARVWSDGVFPCVYCSVTRIPEKIELDQLGRQQIDLIRELKQTYGNVYSILDLRVCPPIPTSIARHYVMHIVPIQFSTGLTHKAFVIPEQKRSQKIVLQAFVSILHLSVSLHNSFEHAFRTINRQQ